MQVRADPPQCGRTRRLGATLDDPRQGLLTLRQMNWPHPPRAWTATGALLGFMLCGAMIAPGVAWQVSASPDTPAPVAPVAATATLKGRVPVLKRKATPTKEYGTQPSFKVEPPDEPTSAVWVGSGMPALDPSTAKVARIEQRGFQFRPALMVVQTGTPVVFPNQDHLYHSVFSFSEVKRFDLGRFRKGEEPDAIVFDKAGQVPIFCEIHDHMRATLVVVDTPWIAQSTPEGSFEISGIAPGSYTATIWLSPKKQVERSITLAAGQTLEVDWTNVDDAPPP